MARETERKFEVPAGFGLPEDLAPDGAAVGDPRHHRLEAVYYDTADLRLARDGVAVRRRTGGHDAGWHVKRYRGGDDRDELQLPATRASVVPARVAAEVRAVSRGRPLQPVVRLTTRRSEWPLVDGDGRVLALVADDLVSATTLGREATVQEWREVEVELADGDRALLEAVSRRLRRAGAVPAAAVSKLARALDGRLPPPPAAPEGTAAAVVAAYLREQRDALVDQDPRVRRDEPDSVHKMRVATRRLRSTLRTYRQLFDRHAVDALRAELRWLGEVLGGVRDAEVLAARLGAALAAEPPELVLGPVEARLTAGLRARAAKDRRALLAALDGDRYATLLDDLDALLAEPATRGRAVEDVLRERVRRAVRRVDRLLAAADTAPAPGAGGPPLPGVVDRDTALHEARKAAKQARYAAEAALPAVGKPAARLVAAATALQEVLGAHHDSVVSRELLRTAGLAAHAAGENAFTYGLLHARQAAEAARLEAELPAVREALADRARRWPG